MNRRIVTPNGAVTHSLNEAATLARLMDAAATPATYDANGVELTPRIEADPATVYEVVDEADVASHPWRLEPGRAEKVIAAKAEAASRINTLAPDFKQRNMIARGVELTDVVVGGGSLTAPEVAEKAALQGAWDYVKAVRAASDTIEAEILASTDPASIDVAGHAAWPDPLI